MQRVMMDYALRWDLEKGLFEQVCFPDHFYKGVKWRFERASVKAECFEPSALSALAKLTRIEPDVSVYLGPRLLRWDVEHQAWARVEYDLLGLCVNTNCMGSSYSDSGWRPATIVASLLAPNPFYVLAHEMMHAVCKTLSLSELAGLTFWGDLIRLLDRSGETFHPDQQCDFLQMQEEAEAEAFGLWAAKGAHPYNIADRTARRIIGDKIGIDLEWVPSALPILEDFYAAILRGKYSGRKNILGQISTIPRKPFLDRLRGSFRRSLQLG